MTKRHKQVLTDKFFEKQEPSILQKSDFFSLTFTASQQNFYKTIRNNFLTVCTGPAGTAKTMISCYAALDLLRDGTHKKIVLTRPIVEAGESLGFIPGTIKEKVDPYMQGYISNIAKIIAGEKLKLLTEKRIISMEPLSFMRSQTFDDTILILDEAQNADLRQIMLVVTRMGKNSRIVICGDVTQWDISSRKRDLLKFYDNVAKGVPSCERFEFVREDIVRNPILIALTDNYDKYKHEKEH